MSKGPSLSDIEEQKRLLIAKADLQRSTFLLLALPVFRAVQAVEVGVYAARFGKSVARHFKR